DVVTEPFESAHEVARSAILVELVDIRLTEVVVGDRRREHVKRGDKYLVCDRYRGAKGSTSSPQAEVLVAKVAAFLLRRGGRRTDQGRLEMYVASTGLARFVLSCAFVVARTHARPRGKAVRVSPDTHVNSDFGDQYGSYLPVHSRDRH